MEEPTRRRRLDRRQPQCFQQHRNTVLLTVFITMALKYLKDMSSRKEIIVEYLLEI